MAAKRASGVGRSRVADPTFDSTSRAKARASPRRHSSSGVSVKSIGTALLPTQSQKGSVFDSPAVNSGSWAGWRPRLGGYVTGRGPRGRCPPPEGVDVAYPPFRVRVWEIMSRGQGLGARRTPPESASVGYSLSQKWLRQGRCRVHDADRTRKRATGAEVLGAQQLGACTRHGQAVESPVTVEARVGDAAHAQRCRRRRET